MPEGAVRGGFLQRLGRFADTIPACLFNLAVQPAAASRFPRGSHHFAREGAGPPRVPAVHPPRLLREREREGRAQARRGVRGVGSRLGRGLPGRGGRACSSPGPESELERFRPVLDERIRELVPQLLGRYRVIGGLTPCDFERLNGTWRGSLYGLKCSFDPDRVVPPRPREGLYLAGQGIVAPGVFGTAISAQLAVTRLLEADGS